MHCPFQSRAQEATLQSQKKIEFRWVLVKCGISAEIQEPKMENIMSPKSSIDHRL